MGRLTPSALHDLLIRALTASGFTPENAQALSRQTVLAEELGQRSVGVAHLFDYVDGVAAGRIDGTATPSLSRPAPAMIHVDGNGGLPQTGFDLAFDLLTKTARALGLCVFLQRNATLCGSLGTFALRLSREGLVCLAATNGSPLLAGSGSARPVFCTNPIAFSAPQEDGPPLLIDQACSATAYVNIRDAAERGAAIPPDWALDRDGRPTTDPTAALEGTMLAFGGARGANIALMVEVLAAGLTGASWSLDAPSFFEGNRCPGVGLFVLAMDPKFIDRDFPDRMGAYLRRLREDHGVHIPGLAKGERKRAAGTDGIEVDETLVARLRVLAG